MQSAATSVEEYLTDLEPDRYSAISKVRETILERQPEGIEEAMNWGMIAYQVPLAVYPDTYNGEPLLVAALASQKHYMAVYLTSLHLAGKAHDEFEAAYRATGKRFDVGKSCVRFRKLDDLPLELIGEVIASISMSDFVATYKSLRKK